MPSPLKLSILSVTCFLTAAACAQTTVANDHWVSAWSTSVQSPRVFPGMPPPLSINGQTVREVIRPTIGGEQFRVRFSNELGEKPLQIGNAHIALLQENGSIVPGTDRALTFSGAAAVSIPAGSPMLTDPVQLKVPAFAQVAISIFVPGLAVPSTFHLLGQHATSISGPGDFSAAANIANAKEVSSWYWLSALECLAPQQTSGIVTFGDSITDGFGAKPGSYADWPDELADRLATSTSPVKFAIDNEGIGGNRILYDGAGVSALARFDRDVLAQPGVSTVILLEGINDIGWPHMKPRRTPNGTTRENPFAAQTVSSVQLILGMKQIIARAHEHNIMVFGATMTPYEGADYFSQDGEAVRAAVNEWIRTSGAFDGVIDFDAAVRDPNHPSQFREDYQSGDHLHPNAAGYKAMADAVDIAKLIAAVGHEQPVPPPSKQIPSR